MAMNLRNKNESGIVLVTVLMLSVVMMILAVGIIGTNVSAVTSGQRQIDRIKSEQLAKGAAWVRYSKFIANPADTSPSSLYETIDGKMFTLMDQDVGPGPGALSTCRTRTFQVSY